jgi:uncharacterized phage protein (TIGR01671 family)
MKKFRIYHNTLKKMLYPPSEFSSSMSAEDKDGNILDIYPTMDMNGNWYIDGVLQDVHWLQYIDVVDKNGNEIYEGDIILTDEAGWKGYVRFDNSIFFLEDFKDGFSSYVSWDRCEILGNLYENSDILEG